jgi:hypothetical protein
MVNTFLTRERMARAKNITLRAKPEQKRDESAQSDSRLQIHKEHMPYISMN